MDAIAHLVVGIVVVAGVITLSRSLGAWLYKRSPNYRRSLQTGNRDEFEMAYRFDPKFREEYDRFKRDHTGGAEPKT